MEEALNKQMTQEAMQAQTYLAYGSWAEVNKFIGISDFLYKHSVEEREHMFKILKYINTRGGEAKIVNVEAPPSLPTSIGDCLRRVMQHEIDNSEAINKIVNLAHEEKDWATFSFAQWFVQEQIEEETLIADLLDKYDLATEGKDENANLFELDKDLGGHAQSAIIPREETL